MSTAKGKIEQIIKDSAEVNVLTRSEWVGNLTQFFDIVLTIVQVLLGVAMLIAVLGIINTLVLSVLERTRELGMLRAIGLRRGQTMRMITVESLVISLFGALLGLAAGAGLATVPEASQSAMNSQLWRLGTLRKSQRPPPLVGATGHLCRCRRIAPVGSNGPMGLNKTGQTRRGVLRAAALAGAAGVGLAAAGGASAAATAGGATPEAAGRRRGAVTTFVFVAGFSGTASGSPELTLLGHRTLGVDLPGHGPGSPQFRLSYQAPQNLAALATEPSPLAGIGLNDYVNQVIDAVRQVARHGPVILVGGSMGGATISRVGNRIPDLIDRIVYESAFCCVDLPTIVDYLATSEGGTSLLLNPDLAAGAIGDPAVLGASRTNWRSANPVFLAAARAAYMAEGSDAEFFTLLNSSQPDESATVPIEDSRVQAHTWGRIKRTYIRHTLDRVIPIALQDRMIREADALTPHNRFDVHTVRTPHVPTTNGFQKIVRILDSLTAR
jgi:pimeloyl-ACP methyl ester carboxylesterase